MFMPGSSLKVPPPFNLVHIFIHFPKGRPFYLIQWKTALNHIDVQPPTSTMSTIPNTVCKVTLVVHFDEVLSGLKTYE